MTVPRKVIPVTFNLPRRSASALALSALVPAVLAGLLAGCSGDPDVLARVGGEPITLAEFNAVARGSLQQYRRQSSCFLAAHIRMTRGTVLGFPLGSYRARATRSPLRDTITSRRR